MHNYLKATLSQIIPNIIETIIFQTFYLNNTQTWPIPRSDFAWVPGFTAGGIILRYFNGNISTARTAPIDRVRRERKFQQSRSVTDRFPWLQFLGTFSRSFFQLALPGMISACFGSFDGNELLLSAGGRVGNASRRRFQIPRLVYQRNRLEKLREKP